MCRRDRRDVQHRCNVPARQVPCTHTGSRHLRAIHCLSGLRAPSKELYSILANRHNLLLLPLLGIAAEINEQEKDRVLNPARCS